VTDALYVPPTHIAFTAKFVKELTKEPAEIGVVDGTLNSKYTELLTHVAAAPE
jgi:hypothetical protein